MSAARFAYTHARLQARHGARPDEGVWRRLAATNDPSEFLQRARATSLGAWLENVSPTSPWHEVETALRRQWREYVADVAAMQPRSWQAAVAWAARLVDLPALRHLLDDGAPPPWMGEDPVLGGLVRDADKDARRALREAGYAPLLTGEGEDAALVEAWLVEWRRRWPAAPQAWRDALEKIAHRVLEHRRSMQQRDADGWPLRRDLEAAMAKGFRQHFQRPAASFCHLLLIALDLERLRGMLAPRMLLYGQESTA